jgi:hypothetical protein
VIPGDKFVLKTPAAARIPAYTIPVPIVLSYREGANIFVPVPQIPPFTADTLIMGDFEVDVLAGEQGFGFGFRTDIIRKGVYGTVLVDTLNLDRDVITPIVEYCPDTTEDIAETSTAVALTSVESCPPSLTVVDDVSQSVLSNLVVE